MSSLSTVKHQLRERFARPGEAGRIVLWSDPSGRYADTVTELVPPGTTILRVDNNEFAIKREIFASSSDSTFLIYRPGPEPQTPTDNWLLDVELAYGVFTADHVSLVVQELGGGSAMRDVVEQYPQFFDSQRRRQALTTRLRPDDDATDIAASMVAAILGTEDRSLDALWRVLLTQHAEGRSTGIDEITRLGLDTFHWEGTRHIYGYTATTPTVEDFVLWLFERAWEGFAPTHPERADEYRNIRRDFSTWRHDLRFADTYRALATHAATELAIADRMTDLELGDLLPRTTFPEADQEIIRRLAQGIESRTLPDKQVQEAVQRRTTSIWYHDVHHAYEALAAASTLLSLACAGAWDMSSPADGVERYAKEWYAVDQAYRRFHRNLDQADTDLTASFDPLTSQVERAYLNDYLDPLGRAWQQQVNTMERWEISGIPSARSFFSAKVNAHWLSKGRKGVVIISDALRYEVAEELGRRIRNEDRFTAELTPMLSCLPSYTQLGMACLLPHTTLAFTDRANVEVDGAPSDGTNNRATILAAVGSTAIQAKDLLSMRPAETRDLVKSHHVLYVFHNQIDATGDKQPTETDTFRACDDAIAELIKVMKKLANANVNNILITADHGFLYQDTPLAEHNYLSVKPHGDTLLSVNHRFVLGRGLKRDQAFTTFTSAQLGMTGDIEVQVPASVHRIRAAGSGVRYVHGGASLQEIVIPVLAVNKRRTSDTRQVPVKIMPETDRITTGQITVMLYQQEPVTEKVKARRLIAGLYAGQTLISDEVTVDCSQTSEEGRDRFFPVTLVLSTEADAYNGTKVELRLHEPVGISQRRPYPDKARFTLVRTFTSDFGNDFDF
ncbi:MULTISPECIES: BREX-1 system phosphatase PglZ type A [Actinomyces]|uniref:BREX-1 system phosphatase PglZ type A n=1 Tax=Actinomyces respiraculi TaxID=2744574 RepID=A0A7T0PV46_9ACTO|nr:MULTISPECIES: BREX-1 system phosphatase PglZ type A [Actinomyces]QPL04896.1 BREX-1 system phosphatase PglZ type A [Actinomyces respiraculi]